MGEDRHEQGQPQDRIEHQRGAHALHAQAKPASAPDTPDWVRRRKATAVPGAVPPGMMWLTDRLDRLMRSSRERCGPPWCSTVWVSWL